MADPMFNDVGTKDFRLKSGSPAIGVGTWHDDMPLYDIDGVEFPNPPPLGAYASIIVADPCETPTSITAASDLTTSSITSDGSTKSFTFSAFASTPTCVFPYTVAWAPALTACTFTSEDRTFSCTSSTVTAGDYVATVTATTPTGQVIPGGTTGSSTFDWTLSIADAVAIDRCNPPATTTAAANAAYTYHVNGNALDISWDAFTYTTSDDQATSCSLSYSLVKDTAIAGIVTRSQTVARTMVIETTDNTLVKATPYSVAVYAVSPNGTKISSAATTISLTVKESASCASPATLEKGSVG